MWFAGGGTYGSTDELGYNAVEINDLQATTLHQLSINHKRHSVTSKTSTWGSPTAPDE